MRSTKLPSWIERLLGIDPLPPTPHVFAIDSDELRYGCFHASPQGFTFEVCHRQPWPEGMIESGVLGSPLPNPKSFWDMLQRFLSQLPGPIEEASLVLPDSWLRLIFMESGDLPKKAAEREAILRFKLKHQVPFKVEDLRLTAMQVTPFPNQDEPMRLMVGFAIETLIKQLEDAFRGVGIELGQVTNNTLALLSGLEHLVSEGEMVALVLAQERDYTLSFLHGREMLFYRYKAFGDDSTEVSAVSSSALAGAVQRDLRLTTSFLRQHFPDRELARVFLAASPETELDWLDWLGGELEVAPEPLGFEHFPLSRTQAGESWLVTGPLLGAAAITVA